MSHHDHGSPALNILLAVACTVIVLAMLFPLFARPRRGSALSSCPWNEQRLGLALVQYAQDNDQQWPSGTQGEGEGWGGQIYPYVKSATAYGCPADETPPGQPAIVSFGYNANAARDPARKDDAAPDRSVLLFEVSGVAADVTRTDEGVSRGAETFSAAGDGTDGSLDAGRAVVHYATGGVGRRSSEQDTQFSMPRHEGGANYLLADGHVRWLKPAQVSSGADAAAVGAAQTGRLNGDAAGTAVASYDATFSLQ